MKKAVPRLFDRTLLRQRLRHSLPIAHSLVNYVKNNLQQRLSWIRRDFKRVLFIGDPVLCPAFPVSTQVTFFSDSFPDTIIGDEEFLPFAEHSFDLVISTLTLQWVNDVPGVLAQIREILVPDGLFLSVLVGGDSLWQLQQVLTLAEQKVLQGVSPRVSPFISVRDGASLLQRAQFALPVADHDSFDCLYPNLLSLMKELRCYGGGNILCARYKGFTPSSLYKYAQNLYWEKFSKENTLKATLNLIWLMGWRPAPSQPQALRRGSAQKMLSEIL